MSLVEKRMFLIKQLGDAKPGPLENSLNNRAKGLPGIIEDFGTSQLENKGTVSIGEHTIVTLKNKTKQVSYVYKNGELLGKYTSEKEYIILPSFTEGLFEVHLLLGNGRWLITAFDEFAKYISHRHSCPSGMKVA